MEFIQTQAKPLMCVRAKCCDANRIIEYVELNFDVNVVVDVSMVERTISNLFVIHEKNARKMMNNNTFYFSTILITLIANDKRRYDILCQFIYNFFVNMMNKFIYVYINFINNSAKHNCFDCLIEK